MVLKAKSRIRKEPSANTMYITIPARVALDSGFIFKEGDRIEILVSEKKKEILILGISEKNKKE